jgi:hypothetical protein
MERSPEMEAFDALYSPFVLKKSRSGESRKAQRDILAHVISAVRDTSLGAAQGYSIDTLLGWVGFSKYHRSFHFVYPVTTRCFPESRNFLSRLALRRFTAIECIYRNDLYNHRFHRAP